MACPNCGATVTGVPYNVGSGPELCCGACETCFGAEGQMLDPNDPIRSFTSRAECLQLLEEWMAWWQESDAPAKLPNSLQVRTGLVLQMSKINLGPPVELT